MGWTCQWTLRALTAPLILIATVVLSFGAAMGISVLLFEYAFNFAGADAAFPLFAFVFLVALGIDYTVFLVLRAKEEAAGHGTKEGMSRAVGLTGGVITAAGIVLAAVFAVLGVLPLITLGQVGIVVGLGILLDTFLVRTLVVPALFDPEVGINFALMVHGGQEFRWGPLVVAGEPRAISRRLRQENIALAPFSGDYWNIANWNLADDADA